MLIASGLTASFLVAGVSAYQLLRNRGFEAATHMLRISVLAAAVLIPVQIAVGDQHGLNTLEHQPAKIAAIEGIWKTERQAPLLLFAVPNAKDKRNDYAISIPYGASLILRHDPDAELQGLDAFENKHPPVMPVFFAFRVMVGIAMLMLAASWVGTWVLFKRRQVPRWLLYAFAAMTFSGWVATLSGWLVTEIGRQPYLVYGLLLTADAASDVPASSIGITLVGYLVIYVLLLLSYIVVVTQLARAAARPDREVPATGELRPTGSAY
jgi:cytochrome d ubiquinol oxidase subunit I